MVGAERSYVKAVTAVDMYHEYLFVHPCPDSHTRAASLVAFESFNKRAAIAVSAFAVAIIAVLCGRPEEIKESDIGTGAGLFEVQKIGDEFYTFIVDCKDPKACTILLRGASKDVLNEVQSPYFQPKTFSIACERDNGHFHAQIGGAYVQALS